jgi:protein-S-isoprenylcysteine O-methyltransferase Ste14
MKIYPTGILTLMIYLPIFIFMLKKNFRKKFNKIHSIKKTDFGIELTVGVLYFLIILLSFFLKIKIGYIFTIGVAVYFLGLIMTCRGYNLFLKKKGLITKDIFAISRNPTYFFGFVSILGIALMTKSLEIFSMLILTFFLTHKIILNEEKYLSSKFGKKYFEYKKKVNRYL